MGVAIAREVARRHPNMRVVLLEKELMLGWWVGQGGVLKYVSGLIVMSHCAGSFLVFLCCS